MKKGAEYFVFQTKIYIDEFFGLQKKKKKRYIDKFGRRLLYIGGLVIMGVGSVLLGIFFLVFENNPDVLAPVAITAIAVFCVGYEMGKFLIYIIMYIHTGIYCICNLYIYIYMYISKKVLGHYFLLLCLKSILTLCEVGLCLLYQVWRGRSTCLYR